MMELKAALVLQVVGLACDIQNISIDIILIMYHVDDDHRV